MTKTRIQRTVMVALLTIGAGSLSACAKHFRVLDSDTGTTYLTKSVKKHRSGSISFTDSVSDRRVSLDSWELEKLDKHEYKAAVESADGG